MFYRVFRTLVPSPLDDMVKLGLVMNRIAEFVFNLLLASLSAADLLVTIVKLLNTAYTNTSRTSLPWQLI